MNRIIHAGRGSALLAALAFLVALLLARGAAQAQQTETPINPCGPSTGMAPNVEFECDAIESENGIVVWHQGGGDNTGTLVLNVPGSATTVTVVPTAYRNNEQLEVGIGIIGPGTGAVTLTVGDAGAVMITRATMSGNPNTYAGAIPITSGHGILVRPQPGGAVDGYTVDVKSGVTIGSSDAPMLAHGIFLNDYRTETTAEHSVSSAARIYAAADGIKADVSGAGKTTIRNMGAIDANRGLVIVAQAGNADGAEIFNSGAITTKFGSSAAPPVLSHVGSGISFTMAGTGESRITNSGAITAAGHGIAVTHGFGTAPSGDGAADSVVVTNNDGGTIEAGTGRYGIWAVHGGAAGNVTVTNHAAVTGGGSGIAAEKGAGSSGSVRVVNSGTVSGGTLAGIYARSPGDAIIENSGNVTGGTQALLARHEVYAAQRTAIAAGNVDPSEGVASVTHSAGTVTGGSHPAIAAYVGRWLNEAPGLSGDPTTPAPPASTATAKVTVTGGTVVGGPTPMFQSAISAGNYENGSVEIDISEGVEVRSTYGTAVEAHLYDRLNTRGRIRVASAGTLSGAGAIYVSVTGTRTAEEARAAGQAPLIDVTWTGTMPPPRVPGARINSAHHAIQSLNGGNAVGVVRGAKGSHGIEAEVMAWRDAAYVASASDDPGTFANNAEQVAFFAADADAATKALARDTIEQLRRVLTAGFVGGIPGADDIDDDDNGTYTDAEITAYLTENLEDPSFEVNGVVTPADTPAAVARRGLLRDILRLGYSAEERAAFDALINSGDEDAVNAALDAVPGATDDWKAQMRAFIGRQNAGDIRIAVNGGSIDAAGDGVGAFYSQSHPMNGAISVTIAEGAEVTGDRAGVYVSGAGDGLRIEKRYAPEAVRDADANADLGEDDLVTIADHLKQVVRVNGTVTGGTDAAVHLSGGGALIVGEKGRLIAGSSGRTILVNDPGPAIIYIAGEARGGEGAPAAVHLTGGGVVTVALTGTVDANGAARAIQGDAATTIVVHMDGRNAQAIRQAAARVKGAIGGEGAPDGVTFAEADASGTTGFMENVSLDDEGALELPDLPAAPETPRSMPFSCGMAADRRCELYEALPSVLLAMNRMPSRAERTSMARGANGVWARVEGAKGEWTAEKSASKKDLSHDYDVFGGRAGFDFSNESVRVGLSAHVLKGKAEMSGVGEILVNGTGFGASATWTLGDFYVDVLGQATWLDAEIGSSTSGKLEKEATGLAGALGVEVGSRVALAEGLFLTPRAGLTLTTANLGDFTDSVGADPARVSVEDAKSAKGVAGLTLEASMDGGGLFGTLDLAQEFTGDTSVKVSDSKLETDVESTSLRVGAGGAFAITESVSVRASGYYETAGSGNSEYGGGVDLNVRF